MVINRQVHIGGRINTSQSSQVSGCALIANSSLTTDLPDSGVYVQNYTLFMHGILIPINMLRGMALEKAQG